MTTRILLLGNTGQVGWELNRTLLTLGDLTALDYAHIDMADPRNIQAAVHVSQPNIIVKVTAQVIAQGRGEHVEYIREKVGLYHIAGGGSCSRYEWAKAILAYDPRKEQQIVKALLPAKSVDFSTTARRPEESTPNAELFVSTFILKLAKWQHSLQLSS